MVELKGEEKEWSDKIDERRDLMREKSSNISRRSSECEKLEKEKNSIELKIKEIKHKKSNLSEHLAESTHQVSSFLMTIQTYI